MGHVIYRASDEKETSVSVVLQDGDTALLNNKGESIGTLKVKNRIVTFVKGSSDEGMRVEVVPSLSDASGGVWLRRAADEGGQPYSCCTLQFQGMKTTRSFSTTDGLTRQTSSTCSTSLRRSAMRRCRAGLRS
jgi:hypothetical protein